jgi:hypothetical protein
MHPLNNVRRPAKGNSLFSTTEEDKDCSGCSWLRWLRSSSSTGWNKRLFQEVKKATFNWSKKWQAFSKDGVAAFTAPKLI